MLSCLSSIAEHLPVKQSLPLKMEKLLIGALAALALPTAAAKASKPNIVVIMSDDQDGRLGSLQGQPFVRDVLAAEGITLENHFATVAQCCPSRTSFLRGQASHNTNLTHVGPPGYVILTAVYGLVLILDRGAYEKFVYSKQDEFHLPHWLNSAGYRTECMFYLYADALTFR